jgi:hypothetical protein
MQDLRIYTLIHKRLSGDIKPEELSELESLEKTENFQNLYGDIESVWTNSKDYFPQCTFDVEAAKAKVKARIATDRLIDQSLDSSDAVKDSSKNNSVVKILAAVAILALIAYLLFRSVYQEVDLPTQVIKSQDKIEYAVLEDNTEVWLSPKSQLEINEFVNADLRAVKLTGEAFFKVTPNANQTFQIDLGKGNRVQVIGTAFNVNSNVDNGTIVVGVKEGIVKIYNIADQSNPLTVNAGELAIFNSKNQIAQKEQSTTINTLLGPVFNFKKTALNTIFNDLSQSFNVEFTYKNATSDYSSCLFTSPLIDSLTLEEIVKLIDEYYPNLSIQKTSTGTYQVAGSCN